MSAKVSTYILPRFSSNLPFFNQLALETNKIWLI